MSFDYDAIRAKKHGGGTQWAAYSDLFMVLAFVFLLMYMVSSLRTEMASVSTHAEIQDVKKELKMYESAKDDYLKEQASEYERKLYEQILNQIALLENEAKGKKDQLAQQYNEQKIREQSLNKYQQMIKTVMNANAIAKADASKRFNLELAQNKQLAQEIEQRRDDLAQLSDQLKAKEEEKNSLQDAHFSETRELEKKYRQLKSDHAENQESLASLEDMLRAEANEKEQLKTAHAKQTRELERKYDNLQGKHDEDKGQLALLENKLSMEQEKIDDLKELYSEEKQNLERKINRLSQRHDDRLQELSDLEDKLRNEAAENRALKNKLAKETNDLENQIDNLQREQDRNQRNIASLERKLESESEAKDDLRNTLSKERRDLEKKIRELKSKDNENQGQMANLEDRLKKKEAEKDALASAYDDSKNQLEDQISQLKDKHSDSLNRVAELSSELDNAQKNLDSAEGDLERAKQDLDKKDKDLAKAMQMERRRKDIAKRIKDNFRNHGIQADVNSDTGDVILDFGDNYFDTDSHDLKPGMEITIKKAIPVYAQSLFGSDLLASLISSVEIIGFASPTYAGRPVDPTKLSVENRTAVNYNLDLSYRRARSIFEYVFDTDKMRFPYQDQMVHLINVTGRSFFAEKVDPTIHSGGLTIDEFCGRYNCLKSQRVIIKFGLSEKGEA